MERDKHVAVVTDSGTSMLPKSPEVVSLGVTVVPLDINFWEDGKLVPYPDDSNKIADIDDFYEKLRSSEKPPQTAGAVPGRFTETFRSLSQKAESIICINITSKESGAWQSALNAKNIVQEEGGPETDIKVVDSKLVSIATWFAVETAAAASIKGATLKEIEDEVLEVLSKTQLYVTLGTFEYLIKGGRAKGLLASLLSIYPVIGFEDGWLKTPGRGRTAQKARNRMIEMVRGEGSLARLAVVHTNAPLLAQEIKDALKDRVKGDIPVYNIKGAIAVHAGPGAAGVVRQKA